MSPHEFLAYELPWTRLKAGYIAMAKRRLLTLERLNTFCWLSVIHQDKATAKALFDLIGEDDILGFNQWNGYDNLLKAKAWANSDTKDAFPITEIDMTKMSHSPAKAIHEKAVFLHQKDFLHEAIELYQKALSIDPHYVHAYKNLGIAYSTQGKRAEAESEYQKALAIQPDDDTYNKLGAVYEEQGKLIQAEQAYKKAITINPKTFLAQFNLANSYTRQGKHEEAVALHGKLIAMYPKKGLLYYLLGTGYSHLGKKQEAVAAYTKALVLDPNNAYANYARYYLEQNR